MWSGSSGGLRGRSGQKGHRRGDQSDYSTVLQTLKRPQEPTKRAPTCCRPTTRSPQHCTTLHCIHYPHVLTLFLLV